MNNLSHRKDFWGMLERHAINVRIVEDDDHLTENLETIQQSEVNRFPLPRIDNVGKTQK